MTTTKNSMFVRILLDASGSMLGSRSATIKGCNEYLDTLAADAVVSVARFAAPYGVKRLSTNVPPARAKVAVEDYECKGGTPLYDAIGTSIQEIDTESKE
jgi:Mg-chelatase subunit ChlD